MTSSVIGGMEAIGVEIPSELTEAPQQFREKVNIGSMSVASPMFEVLEQYCSEGTYQVGEETVSFKGTKVLNGVQPKYGLWTVIFDNGTRVQAKVYIPATETSTKQWFHYWSFPGLHHC